MRITEVVLQGVPGSPELARLSVGSGLTVLVPGPSGRLPLLELLRFALYEESTEPPAHLQAGEGPARIGLTLQDGRGTIYRVLRDVKRGAVQLLKWDPDAQKFGLVSQRAAEVCQYLRAQCGVPAEDVFLGLLGLSPQALPSRLPRVAPEPPAGGIGLRATPPYGTPAAAARMTPPHGLAAAGAMHGGGVHAGGIHGAGMHAAMPSAGPTAAMGGAGAAPRRFQGYTGDLDTAAGDSEYAGLSLAEKKAKLAELETLLRSIESLDEIQFTLDGLQNEAFELDEKMKAVASLEQELKRLDSELARFGDLEALPRDFAAKAKEYEFLKEKLGQTLERIDAEREKLAAVREGPVPELHRDPFLWGGLAAALLLSAGALALEGMRWLLFLNPLALAAAVVAVFRWAGEVEAREQVQEKEKLLDERARKAQRTFDLETAIVRKVMSDLGLETPREVLRRFDERQQIANRRATVSERLQREMQGEDYQEAKGRREALAQRIAELEAKLAGSGGYAANPGDLRRQIADLREAIEREQRGEAPPKAPPGDAPLAPQTPHGASVHPAEGNGPRPAPPDPGPKLLGLLADVFHTDGHAVVQGFAERLGQYLSALTNRAWLGAQFDGKGALELRSAVGGRTCSWQELSDVDRDLVFLALRLALAEAVLRKAPMPLFVEDPFGELDAARQGLVLKMVHYLAGLSQVILQSSDPMWLQGAAAVHQTG
ncbi:MAG: hypothetical protein D6729_12435 [Deltaproteobacteria bacterium]|nr:MAG: hypothetical protein D6729_12435 [Deltaproteobacteria bacterium]